MFSVEPTEEGDYQICFDNSFSRFSEKMIFFEVILEVPAADEGGDDEWAGLGEPESLLEYKLEDIRVSAPPPSHTAHQPEGLHPYSSVLVNVLLF